MIEENKKILESCQRYIDSGIYNKNVALQYERLTGIKLSTGKSGLLGYKELIYNHLYGVLWYIGIGILCLLYMSTINIDLLNWFDSFIILLVSFGSFIEIASLWSNYFLRFYYIDREVLDIKRCKNWLLDILVGKGVVQVSITNKQLVLESCERYISKGINNKYVNKYYKDITGEEREETDGKKLLSKGGILITCGVQLLYGMLLSCVTDILCTVFQVYEYVDIRALIIVGVALLYMTVKCVYTYFIKPKKCKDLSKLGYGYIDYLVGRGYIDLSEDNENE